MVRVVVLCLLLGGVAFAQGGSVPGGGGGGGGGSSSGRPGDVASSIFPGLELPDPVMWLAATHRFVTDNGLHEDVERLGWALLFLGFLVGLVRTTYYASEAEWWAVYGRLLLGIVVLANLGPVQRFTQDTWNTVYTWSSALNGRTIEEEFTQAAAEVGALLTPVLVFGGVGQLFAVKSATRAAAGGMRGLVSGAKSGLSTGAKRSPGFFARAIMYAFLPVFGLYAALVYLSGLTMLLAMLLLPLAGAMVVFPGGLSWWSRWLGMVISGVTTILVLPLMFSIVVSLGMLGPLQVMRERLRTVNHAVEERVGFLQNPALFIRQSVSQGMENVQTAIDSRALAERVVEAARIIEGVDIGGLVTGWVLALVALVVGMAIGLFMMRNFDRVITGFIGGVASGVLPGIPSGRGGGRGAGSASSPPLSGGGGGSTLAARGGGSTGGGGGMSGGGSGLATVSSGGIRSGRGGGGDDAVIDVESREVESLPSSGRAALGGGSRRALGSGS